ncbi:MAG: toll/interleukin-1 receptor domain-containing protein [Verrucomicrobiae bacterium]|nr:toll/interleukin-1 receptor domain-containing protein [Verrucomicrobiae bacterium]
MASTLFIAHSKEDRTRFVEPFSTALRRVEVEPSADDWMLTGRDSLIDRIFREGLRDASALVVVLSRFNAAHEWTQYELEASVVERIDSISRLVVILLDGRIAPSGLPPGTPVLSVQQPGDMIELSTLLQELAPLFIKGQVGQGASPHEDGQDANEFHVPGLEAIDTTLLALACRSAIESNSLLVKAEDVNVLAEPLRLDPETFRLSLESLVDKGHVKARRANGGQISVMEIERESFGLYMNFVLDDFDEIVGDLAEEIVNGVRDNESLVERSQLPSLVVTYILDELDASGQITVIRQMKGNRRIKRLSPEFQQMYGGR